MSYLPNPDLVDPPILCGQKDGQKTHGADVISGPFAPHLTEPSNTFDQIWRDIIIPSQSATSVPIQSDTVSGSASNESEARMNQSVNHGHGKSIPHQELGLVEGFPRTRSGNSLISEDEHDDDSFGCLRTTFKELRLIQQKLTQLVTRMMVPNEELISRGSNVAVGRNPNIGFVCNSRVQITCCHVVCLPFNDGRCQVCKEPVDDTVEHL